MRQTIRQLHQELGLTIFLSSHLLNEVEQICTRIAVMKAGKKVFEGTVAEVKSGRGRVALKTPDFEAAVKLLRERGLITGAVEGKFIALAEGASIADVTRVLVGQGLAVEGIWQQEQTVEDFYLNLVKNGKA